VVDLFLDQCLLKTDTKDIQAYFLNQLNKNKLEFYAKGGDSPGTLFLA